MLWWVRYVSCWSYLHTGMLTCTCRMVETLSMPPSLMVLAAACGLLHMEASRYDGVLALLL